MNKMSVKEAMNILEIDDIRSMSINEIKSIYRNKMKYNHPDVGGNNEKAIKINLAYKTLEELKKGNKDVFIISDNKPRKNAVYKTQLSKLIRIYEGYSENMLSIKEDYEEAINILNIKKYNIMINLGIVINNKTSGITEAYEGSLLLKHDRYGNAKCNLNIDIESKVGDNIVIEIIDNLGEYLYNPDNKTKIAKREIQILNPGIYLEIYITNRIIVELRMYSK